MNIFFFKKQNRNILYIFECRIGVPTMTRSVVVHCACCLVVISIHPCVGLQEMRGEHVPHVLRREHPHGLIGVPGGLGAEPGVLLFCFHFILGPEERNQVFYFLFYSSPNSFFVKSNIGVPNYSYMVFTVCNKAVKYFTKFWIFTLVLLSERKNKIKKINKQTKNRLIQMHKKLRTMYYELSYRIII